MMSSDPSDKHENETKTSRGADLRLGPDEQPTKSLLESKEWLEEMKKYRSKMKNIHEELLGPFFRPNAPYRAKLSLPYEEGEVLVIKGQVRALEDKSPLAATIEVWHADMGGRYDNEGPSRSAGGRSFQNRARLRCGEDGYYEFETVMPGAYERGATQHAAHIHFRVMCPGYVTCVAQLLFSDDKYLEKEPYLKWSEVIDLRVAERNDNKYKEGVFNIILAPQA